MQSSCEVKQSLSASHVQIGLPKNSAVWKASLLHIKWQCIPRVIVPLSGYYPPGPWWPHHSFQCLQIGKRGSVKGGKRSSLDFSRSGDFSPDQKTKNPSLCPTQPLITQQVNPQKLIEVSLGRWGTVPRVVTTISSCQKNTTSRQGIIQLGISFGWIFLLFSNESSQEPTQEPHSYQLGETPSPWLLMTALQVLTKFVIEHFLNQCVVSENIHTSHGSKINRDFKGK